MRMLPASVPCGSCRACCRNNLILLFPDEGDDLASFDYTITITPHGILPTLKHKANGDCVYLDAATGCTIHDRAPLICKAFDCRKAALLYKDDPRLSQDVLEAGRNRLWTLGQ
jgi:uncharacterized protein